MNWVWHFAIINACILFVYTNNVNGVGEFKISSSDENGSPSNYDATNDTVIRLHSNSFITYKKQNHFKKSAKILFWSTLYAEYRHWFWWFTNNSMMQTCPELNCQFTTDKNELNSSDAIFFHAFAENLILKPDDVNFSTQFPAYRLPHQRWVYYTSEPPSIKAIDQSAIDGLFNWTMTYRLDSDVVVHFGKLVLSALPTIDEKILSLKRNFASGKSKLVAWLVSHCSTEGKRELFVKEMEKYTTVDIYGKCGPLKCKAFPNPECYKKIDADYKFYLAFENVLAKDYVTEKFIIALKHDVVPVVFGGADYSRFAPPGSYINALDFDSPKDLVDYLKFLDKNDVEYNKYFDWKRGYSSPVVLRHQLFVCDLCLKLLDSNADVKVYDDINDWWNTQGQAKSWTPINENKL